MNLILKWIQWTFFKKTWGRKNQLHGTRASNVKSDQLQEKRAPRSFSPEAAESVERSAAGISVQSGAWSFAGQITPKGCTAGIGQRRDRSGEKGAFNKAAGDFIVQVEESRSALSRDLGLKGYVGQTKDPWERWIIRRAPKAGREVREVWARLLGKIIEAAGL